MRANNLGEILIAGYTKSVNFPTTAGAYRTTAYGSDREAYITKLDNNLSTLLISTFFGGSNRDDIRDLILDSDDNIFVTGSTCSNDFPMTDSSYDNSFNGNEDVFISKMSPDLSSLYRSTYLGNSNDDEGHCLLQDNHGNILVGGYTSSINYPTTPNAFDDSYNGGYNDCFISMLDSTLSQNIVSINNQENKVIA